MEVRFRDEFRCRQFRLTFGDPEVFGSCQWPWPRPVFVIYRLLAASYVIGWNIYSYVTIPTFGHHVTLVFYTNWSYFVLALHLTLALLVTLRQATTRPKPPDRPITAPAAGHVIAICGSTCTDLPGSVLHYHLEECGRKGAKKRLQESKENGTQDASHVQDVIEGPQKCERTSKRKQRNKDKGHDRDRVKGSNVEPGQMGLKQRFQSVGVNYDGVTELVNKNHDNRSHDHNTATAVDVRQSGKRHHHGSETRRSTAQTTQEVGENRGNIQPEVGDKRGNLQSEVGDKRGNLQSEVGDKRGNSQPEVGDKRGNLQSEVGDKRGNIQSENMKGVDLGPGSDRRRRRRRAARACPGGRSKRPVGFRSRSSNSSLDKIRFRSGRRSTPELKRRSRKSTHNIEIDGPRVSQDHSSQLRESSDKVPINDMPGRRRSRHRHSGAALPEQRMGDQVGGAGSHDNNRSRSKSKGKHTYILQRSRGTPQRLTLKQDEKTSQSQTMNRRVARSTRPRRKPLSSRPTRSVGTNTTGIADLPQRISVIVDNPPLDVGSQPPTSPHPDLPLCMKVSWVVFNIAVTSAPVVSSVYFLVLYPMLRREQPLFHASALDLNLHGINSLIVLLEVLISAFPVRLFHCVFPLAYGLSYVVFSAAYWGMDKQNNILYPVILDWNQPGVAVGVVAVLVGVATPLFQLLWYGVYRLRILVYHRLYGHRPAYSPVRQTVVSDTHRKETQV